MQVQRVTLHRLANQILEMAPVRIVPKEVLSFVRSRGDMEPRTRLEDPQSSRHGLLVTASGNSVNFIQIKNPEM